MGAPASPKKSPKKGRQPPKEEDPRDGPFVTTAGGSKIVVMLENKVSSFARRTEGIL